MDRTVGHFDVHKLDGRTDKILTSSLTTCQGSKSVITLCVRSQNEPSNDLNGIIIGLSEIYLNYNNKHCLKGGLF